MECLFSVHHNFSLMLHLLTPQMQYTFLKSPSTHTQKLAKVHNDKECNFMLLITPIPFGIRNGIIWTPESRVLINVNIQIFQKKGNFLS